jgi:hypothetical protein
LESTPEKQADNGIHHHGTGKLPSRKDIISCRPFLEKVFVEDPLVDPFVMTAKKQKRTGTSGPFPSHTLGKDLTLGGGINKAWKEASGEIEKGFERSVQRIGQGLRFHDHAPSTPVGVVIDGMIGARAKVPEIPVVKLDKALH